MPWRVWHDMTTKNKGGGEREELRGWKRGKVKIEEKKNIIATSTFSGMGCTYVFTLTCAPDLILSR